MNKKLLRTIGIAAMVALAFVLFSNRNSSEYPYRTEMRTLPSETALVTQYFASAYRVFVSDGAYVLEDIEHQMEIFDGLIQRYETLEKIPEHARDDYEEMMAAIYEQQQIFSDIYEVAKKGAPIPGELALGLKKVVERRVMYEGRMARY